MTDETTDDTEQREAGALQPAPDHVLIDYTNHRGERRQRTVIPYGISYGSTEWHPEAQWLLNALALDKSDIRSFAMKDIHSWKPVS